MRSRDSLLKEALQLPPIDRAWLVDALNESVDAAAWTAEIDRRLEAFANGGHTIDADESLERIRQALASYQSE